MPNAPQNNNNNAHTGGHRNNPVANNTIPIDLNAECDALGKLIEEVAADSQNAPAWDSPRTDQEYEQYTQLIEYTKAIAEIYARFSDRAPDGSSSGKCKHPPGQGDSGPHAPTISLTPSTSGTDRKGNRYLDTLFEAHFANLIYSRHRKIYEYSYLYMRNMGQLLSGYNIFNEDHPTSGAPNSKNVKDFSDRFLVELEKDSDEYNFYLGSYYHHRRNYPEIGGRGRVDADEKLELGEEDKRTGPMTPRSSAYFGLPEIENSKQFAAWKWYDPARSASQTNVIEEERARLGLPFIAGPSGSMAFSTAMCDYGNMYYNYPADVMMFTISLATHLVRRGHHSYFEAFAPFDNVVFGNTTKRDFYETLVAYYESLTHNDMRARILLEKCYGKPRGKEEVGH